MVLGRVHLDKELIWTCDGVFKLELGVKAARTMTPALHIPSYS